MSLLDHPRHVSVTEATQRGVAGIVSDASHEDIVVTRRNRPVAVIVRFDRIRELEDTLEDLRDLTLAVSRTLTDKPDMVSFDDVLAAYGLTDADLDAAQDLE